MAVAFGTKLICFVMAISCAQGQTSKGSPTNEIVSKPAKKATKFKNVPSALKRGFQKLTDKIVEHSAGADMLSLEDVGVSFESCGTSEHAMQVKSVHWDPKRNLVTAEGRLSKLVTGGNVTASVHMGKDPTMSVWNRLKTKMALGMSGIQSHHEDLCQHAARGKSRYEMPIDGLTSMSEAKPTSHECPLSQGQEMLHFTLKRFPKQVMAGPYDITVKAVEANGKPVVCLKGKVVVPRAANGESLRLLQEAGTVSNANKAGLNFFMFLGLFVLKMAWK